MFILGHQIILSSSNNDLVKTLPLCNYNNDNNDNNNKDNLVWFAHIASLALFCLCGHVGGPKNMAAVAAAAVANANS